MTDKQKEAIKLINSLNLDENKYFLLLDFIMQKQQVEYVPYYPTYPTYPTCPTIQPYYYDWKTVCTNSNE